MRWWRRRRERTEREREGGGGNEELYLRVLTRTWEPEFGKRVEPEGFGDTNILTRWYAWTDVMSKECSYTSSRSVSFSRHEWIVFLVTISFWMVIYWISTSSPFICLWIWPPSPLFRVQLSLRSTVEVWIRSIEVSLGFSKSLSGPWRQYYPCTLSTDIIFY